MKSEPSHNGEGTQCISKIQYLYNYSTVIYILYTLYIHVHVPFSAAVKGTVRTNDSIAGDLSEAVGATLG